MQQKDNGIKFLTAKALGLRTDQVTIEEAQFSVHMSSLLHELSG